MKFESVIGLEVHAQLKTQSKIFCGCSTQFGAAANTHTCPVCLGMPGVLPVLNKKVVEYTIKMALATNCRIAAKSRFARKNYFYPDLPKGYQISQYELPIAQHGYIDIETEAAGKKRIGITRIHMEEDAGKLIHDPDRPISHVDYNRTGVALMEIVSEPDIRFPEEAGGYLRHLRAILRYLDICDGNMEEGSFRCDANISIRPAGDKVFGTRTEIKNLNSFKHVEKALEYEIVRQKEMIADGDRVVQETRLWNPDKNITTSMRGKEEAHDYRYFPDPDLLPLVIPETWIEKIKKTLPELPEEKKQRFIEQYQLPAIDAEVLISAKELADYFENCVQLHDNAKQVCNWIMGPILGLLKAEGKTIDQSPVDTLQLTGLLKLIDEEVISGKIGKTVFDEMARTGKHAKTIIEQKGLAQVSDVESIRAVVDEILSGSKQQVEQYKSGKTKVFGFFVGQVMKKTRGKANPQVVNEVLKKALES
ncbi:MAG: Asp-tRNA(Asn)/Glu-tRNA(Gln) amidotransferase subunit GatB [Desulfobacterales bacterium]